MDQLKICVGSKNPVKIEGVRLGAEKLFPDATVVIEGIKAPSSVPDQPYGTEETLLGAQNRAHYCREQAEDFDYFVGLEAGMFKLPNNVQLSSAYVCILDKEGNEGIGMTSAHIVPPRVCALMAKGMELGEADDIVFAQKNSKQSGGSIGLLTDGVYTRTDKTIESVICAFTPHKNKEFYF